MLLRDVTTKIGSGATPRGGKGVYTDDGVAFIRSQNVYDNRFSFDGLAHITDAAAETLRGVTVQPDDVLINITGESVTRTCVVDPGALPARVSQHVAIIRPDTEQLDSGYLNALLQSPPIRQHLNLLSSAGATRRALTKSHLEGLAIDLPGLPYQRRVAGVLDALGALINANRRLAERLDTQITALFQRLLNTAHLSEMQFFDVFDVDFGAAFKGSGFASPGMGMPLLRIRDLKTQRSDVWSTDRLAGDTVVRAGDVLVGMDAEFRPTLWVGADSLLNQRVCRVRPKQGSLAWAREALKAPMAHVEGYKTGTTVAHLNKGDLQGLRIEVPSASDRAKFDGVAQPLQDAIVALNRENVDLICGRDELLPLLMSGRVQVDEVERIAAWWA